MTGKTVLVLGGGWGGLMAANSLRGQLGPEHRVVVVEKKNTFSLCPSHLWVMTGERDPRGVERSMSRLAQKGIEWVRGEVRRVEPGTRTVHTDSGVLRGDFLVIALGADLHPEGVDGFAGACHNLYAMEGAESLRQALARFGGGRVVILVSRTPFKCPPAPYEAAFLMEWLFRKRSIREKVRIAIYTPEKQPMTVAGPEVGATLRGMLAQRGIDYFPEHTVTRIDGASGEIHFGDGRAPYDLLVGVPPHRAPRVVSDAGLTDATGYVPVHPQTLQILANPDTLETRHPGIFAIGDATSIRLLNGMLLPKAGIFAEEEARVVAGNIAAAIHGQPPAAAFNGRGVCYVEVGDGMAAPGSGNFYAYPAPWVSMEPPSPEGRRAKEEYEKVLETWFAR